VLLLPDQDEADRLRQMQASLRSVFGGTPHEPVHLTCQRFAMVDEHALRDIIHHLEARLALVPPVPVIAASVAEMEHRFWQSRLLRWRIQVTAEVRHLVKSIEDGLVAARVTPHFPCDSGWVPTRVTALEGISLGRNLHRRLSEDPFPLHLFTGRQVILSSIVGQRAFEILWTMQLTGKTAPSDCL
jgi:hypothetical protein